jgi:hypothetical protein
MEPILWPMQASASSNIEVPVSDDIVRGWILKRQ